MTASNDPAHSPANPVGPPRPVTPRTRIGWVALVASAVGLASWLVLPMITVTFRTTYPVTDTWVMPAIGLVLIDVAALVNVLAVWRWRERSVLNLIAAVVTVPLALLVSLFVVGSGIGGA